MFHAARREFRNLSAAIDPRWNWKGMQPIENSILDANDLLPDVTKDFMAQLEGVVNNGTILFEGGALNDLASGKIPKDFDGHILSTDHPVLALLKVERWARRSGYEIVQPKRNIRMLWKRTKILTDHGEYDLSCMWGISAAELSANMADRGDVSPCARSATRHWALQSERCLKGEERDQLIYRSFKDDRGRFGHFRRWVKYAIDKYPQRAIVYQTPEDTDLFAPLNAARRQISDLYAELVSRGEKPKDFEPFRHFVPELFASIAEKAGIRL